MPLCFKMNPTDKKTSPLFSSAHGDYLEQLHQQYQENPESLSSDWQAFFYELESQPSPSLPSTAPIPSSSTSTSANTSHQCQHHRFPSSFKKCRPLLCFRILILTPEGIGTEIGTEIGIGTGVWNRNWNRNRNVADPDLQLEKELGVARLIEAYRNHGHLQARLNPLDSLNPSDPPDPDPDPAPDDPPSPSGSSSHAPRSPSHPYFARASEQLDLSYFGLGKEDLKKEFHVASVLGFEKTSLENILHFLKRTYCGALALQVQDTLPSVKQWFFKQFERKTFQLSKEEKTFFFHSLNQTEGLERFLHSRFVGQKRFSIEGAEVLIPMLEFLCRRATASAAIPVREMVIGMAHRGRINILNNFMEKALEITLAGFAGHEEQEEKVENWENDVKYHLGFSADKKTPSGTCHISLAFNPSHLESVNAVALGMARAKQRKHGDMLERKKVLPLLIHGDAAFAGQGVVAEALQLSQLKGYTVGGTIHIIIDNQVGFTTNPQDGRSSFYASDMMKIIQAPVLHVNADDLEACLKAVQMAFDYRSTYGQDILINLLSYRRYGHNEGDEPSFTQPLMYKHIRRQPTVRELYGSQLIQEGVLKQEAIVRLYEESRAHLQSTLEKVRKGPPPTLQPLAFEGLWQGLRRSQSCDFETKADTRVPLEKLKSMAKTLGSWPKGFEPHPKLQKILRQRQQLMDQKGEVDWALGELLAYASLLEEGFSVRLSGQDSVRGTFSHRHALFTDCQSEEVYNPFAELGTSQGTEFCIYNSPLSEVAVLGFEYGNSIVDPTFLTLWEAQFGDFCNGAQVIIDQFISSGESKWQRMSGLVLLLPHGYEGMGPEHSSARLERFLSLCAQDNIQVCHVTTPAQIFHVLRRQMKRDFRKPLVIMSPKSLLRHPRVRSSLKELAEGSFQEVLFGDGKESRGLEEKKNPSQELASLEQLFLCSGKIYYELLEEKEKLPSEQQAKVALVRFEQLYPFPQKQLLPFLHRCPSLQKIHWVQEEPKNMGAWPFILSCWREMQDTQSREMKSPSQNLRRGQRSGQRNHQKSSQRQLLPLSLNYIGREPKASPATGSSQRHREEQRKVIEQCFKIFQKQKKQEKSKGKSKGRSPRPKRSSL